VIGFWIFDFGFWIEEKTRGAVFNPKSKIQNPKSTLTLAQILSILRIGSDRNF